jgi:hypothetical protein
LQLGRYRCDVSNRAATDTLVAGRKRPRPETNNVTTPTRDSGRTCPFCNVTTDVPHESQAACIEALHGEIDRMRDLLASTSKGPVSAPPAAQEDEHESNR